MFFSLKRATAIGKTNDIAEINTEIFLISIQKYTLHTRLPYSACATKNRTWIRHFQALTKVQAIQSIASFVGFKN